MAKNFEHLIHKHSNVTTNGSPKLPTSGQIEFGELAVNYAKDKETISLKNANNEIVTFSSDAQIQTLIDTKQDVLTPGDNITITNNVISADFRETEEIIANALNDLDKRITETNSSITELGSAIDEMDEVTASSLNDLNGRIINLEEDVDNLLAAILPSFTASDNGKILGIVNGALAWVSPSTIYTGTGTPSSSQGNDGDIYLQTS